MVMDLDDRQQLAMELHRTRMTNNNSLGRMSVHNALHHSLHRRKPPIGTLGKSPPRPSPASVPYHSDDDSVKGYDENPDDSSVTEKPSEISSSDSQVSFKLISIVNSNFDNYSYFAFRDQKVRTKVCDRIHTHLLTIMPMSMIH